VQVQVYVQVQVGEGVAVDDVLHLSVEGGDHTHFLRFVWQRVDVINSKYSSFYSAFLKTRN